MKRRILLIAIVACSLTVVICLLETARLQADATGRLPMMSSMKSVASGASFSADPPIQGRFAQPGKNTEFELAVANTGSSSSDTYELVTDSAWPVTLFGPDGITPLADTNGSGTVDTGAVASGQVFTIKTRVETPPNELIGDENTVELTITSFISPSLVKTAYMQQAIPAPFVQTLYERSNRAMSLIMSQPVGTWQMKTTPDSWFGEPGRFPELAVAETLSGYAYGWNRWRYQGTVWVSEIEFTLTDKAGLTQTQLSRLTDHSSATLTTIDEAPAVAVAPDGRIGLAWYRSILKDDLTPNQSQKDNVYLAILDASGNVITDTIGITDNLAWWSENPPTLGVPRFTAPRIAATRDNRFVVAWESSVLTNTVSMSEPVSVSDVYYAIYNTDGVTVTGAVSLTNNLLSEDSGSVGSADSASSVDGIEIFGSMRPAVSAAGDNQILFSWNHRRPVAQGGDDIFIAAIDSDGVIVEPPKTLSDESDLVDWLNFDLVELSTGDFIGAWQAYGCDGNPLPRIRYAVIKKGSYNQVGLLRCLPPTVVGEGGDDGISLVADNAGQVIFTWTDKNPIEREKLYYALLRGNGIVVTNPMIFHEGGPGDKVLSTGTQGYGSASRIYLDAAIAFESEKFTIGPDGAAEFNVNYSNLGIITGANLAITLALPPGLAYVADSASITPTLDGTDVIWNYPQLLSWEDDLFGVKVVTSEMGHSPHGFPLTVTISVNGSEASLANNIDRASLVVVQPVYLPIITRPE